MNILMIYPRMMPTLWINEHLMDLMGKKASYPPMGLLTVAAMLPNEWNKRLIDLNVLDYEVDGDLSEILSDDVMSWADYAFIGAMNVQARSAQQIIHYCNAKGLKVVAGGPLFTHEHDRIDGVDHFVLNEAEITLPLFLADLMNPEAGPPKRLYETADFANMHETPIPQWDLVNVEDYAYMIVQYSRGCPYMCDFCDVTALFGRKPRSKTAEQIVAELDALGDLNHLGMILFADDNLIGNRKHLREELLPALIEWRGRNNVPIGFATQVTINLVDDAELSQLMLEAGFRHIFCGIESIDEETLITSQKRQNTKRNLLDNVHRLQEQGYVVYAGFIVGFDNDTPAVHRRMVEFIQESGIVSATVNTLKAPPGTELYDKMRKAGRLIEPFDFSENESNIIPVTDPETLYRNYEWVLGQVYTPRSTYQRARNFLAKYPGAKVRYPMRPRKLNLKAIYLVMRAVWLLGILNSDRRHFWSLALWTLARRRRFLGLTFLYATLALQWRRMYEGYDMVKSAQRMARAIVEMPARSEFPEPTAGVEVPTPAESGARLAKSA